MANRVVITICGEEYTLVADETSAYMQKVGSCVSDKMTEVMNDAKVGRTDAAVLTAVNLTDEPIDSRKLQSLHRSPHLDSIILRFLLLRTAVPAALAFPSSGRSLQTVQMLPNSSRKQNIPQGLYKCRGCRPKSRASAP